MAGEQPSGITNERQRLMAAKLTNVQRLERVEAHVRSLLDRVHKLEQAPVRPDKESLSKKVWEIKQQIENKEIMRSEMYSKYGVMMPERPEVLAVYQTLRRDIVKLRKELDKL